jgi:hypothetical protein
MKILGKQSLAGQKVCFLLFRIGGMETSGNVAPGSENSRKLADTGRRRISG